MAANVSSQEQELKEDVRVTSVVLERRTSYFADDEGFDALMKHLGNNPLSDAFKLLREGLDEINSPKPTCQWENIDADVKSLINGLT